VRHVARHASHVLHCRTCRLKLALLLAVALLFAFASAAHAGGSNGQTDCSNTAGVIVAANIKRLSWLLTAPTTNSATVYVGFSSAVTTAGATRGIPIDAGGVFSDSTYTGDVYCIVAAGTQPLIYGETTR